VGGLIVSQILTLYTTPVVYIYMEKVQKWFGSKRQLRPKLKAVLSEPAV
jgi:hypothetical protein